MEDPLPLFPDLLPQLPFKERAWLPDESGIYVVLNRAADVLYIGLARNLKQRWRRHTLHKIGLLQDIVIAYHCCPIEHLRVTEEALIAQFQPPINLRNVHDFSKGFIYLPSTMCEWCAQSFTPRMGRRAKGKDRFCSQQCQWAAQVKQVWFTCAWCHTEFSRSRSYARTRQMNCCSIPCKEHYAAQQQLAHFWDMVDQSGGPDACWPWMGSLDTKERKYGRFSLCKKQYRAHRMAFILVNGLLADDELVRHTCDNRICCNPIHLLKGTHIDNMRDMVVRNRHPKGDHLPYHVRPRGSKHGMSKFNETTAKQCFALKGTMTQIAAGLLFGINRTAVADLWSKKTWKHIHNSQ